MRNAFKKAAGISLAVLFSSAVMAADNAPYKAAQAPQLNIPQVNITPRIDALLEKQTEALHADILKNSPLANPDLMRAYKFLIQAATMAEQRHIKKPASKQLLKGHSLNDFIEKLSPDKTYKFADFYPLIIEEINVMLSDIDPHSYYSPPIQQASLSQDLSGEKTGIGIYYEDAEDGILITGIVKNSPAQKAGLKSGDIITEIDGIKLDGDKKSQFDDYISSNNEISFGLKTTKSQETPKIDLIKGQMNANSLDISLINDDTAYITLFLFTAQTAEEFKEKFTRLNKAHGSAIKKLVFDLRNNGGGILDSATKLADLLTKQDLLLGLTETTPSSYSVKPVWGDGRHQITDLPISIVINNNSASSAEIFAGILQDYGRARIIGKTSSFGKGTFQQNFIQVVDGQLAAMALTTGYITLPISGPYQGKGIWPDIHVTDNREDKAQQEPDTAQPDQTAPSYERDMKNYIKLSKSTDDYKGDAAYRCQISPELKSAFIKVSSLYSTSSEVIDMSEDASFLCAIDQYNTDPQYSHTFQTAPKALN
tara:strand:- start:13334 stop:14950 length:1617 start_codon:yes stop_codon:yes gene_type:complete